MTRTELFQILRPMIERIAKCIVILADPNAPAPKGLYCAVQPFTSARPYAPPIQRKRVSNHQTIVTALDTGFVTTTTLNFYRNNSVDTARKLTNFQFLPSVIDECARKKIGINSVGPIHNLTGLFAGNQEERASVTLEIFLTERLEDEVNTIEQSHVILENEEERILAEWDVKV